MLHHKSSFRNFIFIENIIEKTQSVPEERYLNLAKAGDYNKMTGRNSGHLFMINLFFDVDKLSIFFAFFILYFVYMFLEG